jgi:hypothetical protein
MRVRQTCQPARPIPLFSVDHAAYFPVQPVTPRCLKRNSGEIDPRPRFSESVQPQRATALGLRVLVLPDTISHMNC